MVGEITVRSQVEMPAWRTLLDLLGSDPEDLRGRGGLARALTTAGGVGIEIAELDYSGLVTDDAAGTEASWEFVISACMQKDGIDLDEKTLRILEEIASDPARLAEFYERTERQPGAASTRDRAAGLLRALEGIAGLVGREDPDRLDGLYDNMAAAVSRLSPDFVTEPAGDRPRSGLAARRHRGRGDPAHHRPDGGEVRRRGGRGRSRVHRAPGRRLPRPGARPEAARVGRRASLARNWSARRSPRSRISPASGPTSNACCSPTRTSQYISDDYDREMVRAQSHADDSDRITDDPPERIASWLTTVSDQSIRALDLQLLADLLLVVADAAERQELLQLVVSQVEELVALGDFDAAHRLVESMAALARKPEAPDAAAQVARAIERTGRRDIHVAGGGPPERRSGTRSSSM